MSYTLMEQIRWWLPIISAFGLIIKAYTSTKKNVAEFVERLLSNHLAHIETATVSNAEEAKQTNVLLKDHSGKLEMVQATLSDNHAKQLRVWSGVVKTLALIEDRTRTPKRKVRNG
jgi:hypothetical protein